MHEEPKEKYSLVQENSSKIDIPTGRLSSFSVFFDKVHSVNGLHLLSALFQIILGSTVVALSVLDMVQPVLLAAIDVGDWQHCNCNRYLFHLLRVHTHEFIRYPY